MCIKQSHLNQHEENLIDYAKRFQSGMLSETPCTLDLARQTITADQLNEGQSQCENNLV